MTTMYYNDKVLGLYGVYDGGFIYFLLGLLCQFCLSYYVFFSKLVLVFIS